MVERSKWVSKVVPSLLKEGKSKRPHSLVTARSVCGPYLPANKLRLLLTATSPLLLSPMNGLKSIIFSITTRTEHQSQPPPVTIPILSGFIFSSKGYIFHIQNICLSPLVCEFHEAMNSILFNFIPQPLGQCIKSSSYWLCHQIERKHSAVFSH